ncbi:MAG: glycosyltransferase family 9 protein [Desulfovibrionaceae bacterium]
MAPPARMLPDRWCVVRLGHLGDVALATGVLRWWHATRGWRFVFVTRAANAPLLQGHPAIDTVVAVPETSLDGAAWLAQCRALAARFPGHGLLDLHGTLRSRVLARSWTGPVRRYPKFPLRRRLYLATRWPLLAGPLFATNVPQRYALAVEAAAPDRAELLPSITLAPAELEAGRVALAPLLRPGAPCVALHPYATHPDKAWPADHWRTLAARLDAASVNWFAIGRADAPIPGLDAARDFTNRTDLRQTCALLAHAAALVTGDSGPMHLASGVGTPVISLFGPTNAAWGFVPAGPRDVVLERPLACRPCSLHGKRPCPHGRECLAGIAVDAVMDAVGTVIRA